MSNLNALRAAAEKLIKQVEFDVSGEFGKGGNGGLTSNATIRAADECRLIINALDAQDEKKQQKIEFRDRYLDDNGTLRFKPNKLVQREFEHGRLDLNECSRVAQECGWLDDYAELCQMLGYSADGYMGLQHVSDTAAAQLAEILEQEGAL